MDWLLYLGVAVLGAAGGYLGHRFLSGGSKKQAALEQEVESMREQMDGYKSEVNDHFEETARLFNGMTEQYQAIYRHLAKGAGTLCKDQDDQTKLSAPVWQAAIASDVATQSNVDADPDSPVQEVDSSFDSAKADAVNVDNITIESFKPGDTAPEAADNIVELAEQIIDGESQAAGEEVEDAEEIIEPPRDYADVPDNFDADFDEPRDGAEQPTSTKSSA